MVSYSPVLLLTRDSDTLAASGLWQVLAEQNVSKLLPGVQKLACSECSVASVAIGDRNGSVSFDGYLSVMLMRSAATPDDARAGRTAAVPLVAVLIAVAAAGLIFRSHDIGGEPLWLDEAYSAYAADKGWRFLWLVVPRYEAHPPFYYALLHVWSIVVGDGLLARRMLGLLCGLATVVLTGAAARSLPGHRSGAVVVGAVALTALHPLLIAMSREVRPYPMMDAVYAAATIALLRLCTDAEDGRRLGRGAIFGFFTAQAAMLWLHDLGPFYGLAMLLALLAGAARRGLSRADWGWLIGGQAIVSVCYLPALLITLAQATAWTHSTWLRFDPATVPGEIGTIYWNWNVAARLAGVLLALAGAASLARERAGARAALALLALAPVFLARTLSPTAVPAILICAAALGGTARQHWAAAALIVLVLVTATAQDVEVTRDGPRQDWYGALGWLMPRIRAGDEVWTYPNDGALPLGYALRDEGLSVPVRPIPGPVPALGFPGTHPTGTTGVIALYRGDIARVAAGPIGQSPRRIWLIQVFGPIYDPTQAMATELGRTRPRTGGWHSRGIDITGFGAANR